MADERVLAVTVFKRGDVYVARTEAASNGQDVARSWNPAWLPNGDTAVDAAERALAHVRRTDRRKPGRKPSGYTVARALSTKSYLPSTK